MLPIVIVVSVALCAGAPISADEPSAGEVLERPARMRVESLQVEGAQTVMHITSMEERTSFPEGMFTRAYLTGGRDNSGTD